MYVLKRYSHVLTIIAYSILDYNGQYNQYIGDVIGDVISDVICDVIGDVICDVIVYSRCWNKHLHQYI